MAIALHQTTARPTGAELPRRGLGATDLLLILMSIIWGVNFAVVKFGTSVLAPLAFNGLRVGVAALALVLLVAARRAPPVASRDRWALLALGVLGNGLYQIFFIEGIARTRAGNAALVLAANPALIALIGRMLGVERVRPRALIGIALSMAGIALVVLGSAASPAGRSSLTGNLLMVGGALCWSLFTVLLQPYTHRVDGLRISALTMVGGAVPLLLFTAPALAAARWSAVPALGFGALLYSSLLALVLAYYIWYRGVRVIGPTRTAMYSNLQPVVALLFAWVALAEVPTAWQWMGAATIIGGVLLTRS